MGMGTEGILRVVCLEFSALSLYSDFTLPAIGSKEILERSLLLDKSVCFAVQGIQVVLFGILKCVSLNTIYELCR